MQYSWFLADGRISMFSGHKAALKRARRRMNILCSVVGEKKSSNERLDFLAPALLCQSARVGLHRNTGERFDKYTNKYWKQVDPKQVSKKITGECVWHPGVTMQFSFYATEIYIVHLYYSTRWFS
jgi:hypothetical protein